MPVSGLVLSLRDEPQLRAETLAVMGGDSRITVGVCEGNRLAIVLDTCSSEEDQRLWAWLESLPGVLFVEVAFIGFEQPGEAEQVSALGGPEPDGRCLDE